MPKQKSYFTRTQLRNRKSVVSFNIGDHDQLATDNKLGEWFFRLDSKANTDVFRGPYPNKRAALTAWKTARRG